MSQSYKLKVRQFSRGVVVLSHDRWSVGSNINIVGEVLNNTGQNRTAIQVQITYSDATGVIGTSVVTYVDIVTRLGRSSFSINEPIPGGDTFGLQYSLKVVSATATTEKPVGSLNTVLLPRYVDAAGIHHYPGQLTNGHAGYGVEFPMAIITLYDSLGKVRNTNFAFAEDEILPPRQTTAFDVTFAGGEHVAGVNRRVLVAQAWRIGTMGD